MTAHASKKQKQQVVTIIIAAAVLALIAAIIFIKQAEQGKFPLPGENSSPITVLSVNLAGGGGTPADI